jgi:hypothetical protein
LKSPQVTQIQPFAGILQFGVGVLPAASEQDCETIWNILQVLIDSISNHVKIYPSYGHD